jgi:crossover junction endodeoxyribonuclease RuvC
MFSLFQGAYRMLILGIDPGISKTGFGIIEKTEKKIRYIDSGLIQTKAGYQKDSKKYKYSFYERFNIIRKTLSRLFLKYNIDEIAIELPFYNRRNAKALITQSMLLGALKVYLSVFPVYEYANNTVSRIIGISKKKKNRVTIKQDIATAIKNILHTKKHFESDDESDALAIAYCHSVLCDNPKNHQEVLF